MEFVELNRIVEKLESGSREKGGSVTSGIISIGGTHLSATGGFKWEKKEFISEEFYSKMRGGKVEKNDILIVKDGATTGKTSFVGEDFPFKDAAINEHVFRVQIKTDQANPKYVFYFLHSPKGQEQILNDFRGATVGGISRGFVDLVKIPLPDLETQNKIVAILDKAKALLDKREKTIAMCDDLLRATFLDMFGDPVKNDKAWTTLPFDKTGKFFSGGTPDKSIPQFWIGSFPWVSPKDMKVPTIEDSQDHISDEVFEKTSLKRIAPNHLLIVVRGMILAHSFPTAINAIEVAINQDMKAIKPVDELHVLFLQHCVKTMTPYILSLISTAGHGTKKFDSEAMKKIDIPIPPMSLQMLFVRIVSKINSVRAKLEISQAQTKSISAALSSIAFKGELTFNIAVNLEVLLEKDYEFFKRNARRNTVQLLLDRLDKIESNDKKFYESSIYEKAKSFLFELLKEGKVQQVFDEQTKSVKLTVA